MIRRVFHLDFVPMDSEAEQEWTHRFAEWPPPTKLKSLPFPVSRASGSKKGRLKQARQSPLQVPPTATRILSGSRRWEKRKPSSGSVQEETDRVGLGFQMQHPLLQEA